MGKKENKIESAYVASVYAMGGESYKFVSPGRRGVPDRLTLLPISDPLHREIVSQYVEFVECKASPGDSPRKEQTYEIAFIKRLGFKARVVDSLDKI